MFSSMNGFKIKLGFKYDYNVKKVIFSSGLNMMFLVLIYSQGHIDALIKRSLYSK